MRQNNREAFVDAYLRGEMSECAKILNALPESLPERTHCEAVMLATMAEPLRRTQADPREAIAKLRTALESPPADAALFRIELMAATRLFGMERHIGEGLRFLRLLKQISESEKSVLVRANVLRCEAAMAFAGGDMALAHEFGTRACRLRVPAGGALWYLLRLGFVLTATMSGQDAQAERMLAEVEAQPPSDPELRDLMALRRIRVLWDRCRPREGLAYLDSLPPSSKPYLRHMGIAFRTLFLLLAGRYLEAQRVLDAGREFLPETDRELLQAKVCHFRGDLEGVREHCRRAMGFARSGPLGVRDNALELAGAELAAGNIRAAKALLRMADPEEDRNHLFWAAVHLLEGRPEEAARRFRRALDDQGRPSPRELLFSLWGLRGPQIATLWTLAEELDPTAPAAAPAAAPVSPAATRAAVPETGLVGDSPAMREVRDKIARFAPMSETVLITGETGTGKDLVARLLHEIGPRTGRPFIAVNCASISDTLIESELFGHVKGAFTGAEREHEGLFEAAGDGSIFLDEISSMSVRLQAALLRVLENSEIRPVGSAQPRKISCRVIAASNRPLEEMVRRGEFRSDLYYRLTRLQVRLPPLRERTSDIPLLAGHLLHRMAAPGQAILSEGFVAALLAHSWPGNVRELRNELERAMLLAGGGGLLLAESLSFRAAEEQAGRDVTGEAGDGGPSVSISGGGEPLRVSERIDALREMFRRERKLTRGRVIRTLGCAPNSATRYLKILQEEGLIERVHTSESLHTSYFVLKEQDGGGASKGRGSDGEESPPR